MSDGRRRFEAEALVHLDAAYNLARWLVRSPADADDVVQEAMLRAWRAGDQRRGEDVKPWLLAIVRNCALSFLERRTRERARRDDGSDGNAAATESVAVGDDPLAACERDEAARTLDEALDGLAPEFREVLVLRELEDLTYREIAEVLAVPLGTVMSRLARARAALREAWSAGAGGDAHGLS
jgi:RNA polymerase sigma-70 factor (ECF subfamily)